MLVVRPEDQPALIVPASNKQPDKNAQHMTPRAQIARAEAAIEASGARWGFLNAAALAILLRLTVNTIIGAIITVIISLYSTLPAPRSLEEVTPENPALRLISAVPLWLAYQASPARLIILTYALLIISTVLMSYRAWINAMEECQRFNLFDDKQATWLREKGKRVKAQLLDAILFVDLMVFVVVFSTVGSVVTNTYL